jgi:hypothetical protein
MGRSLEGNASACSPCDGASQAIEGLSGSHQPGCRYGSAVVALGRPRRMRPARERLVNGRPGEEGVGCAHSISTARRMAAR